MMADSGTYDQATITRRQKIAEQMLADSSKPRVIRNPIEGLGYLANVGADVFTLNRLDKQANESRKADTAALMSILNGGGAAPSPSAVASPSPAPAMPPPSPTVIGASGPAKPDAQGVYDSDAMMMPQQPDFGKAIAGIESGGKYDAMGPVTKTGDQAYGKYQVMGANLPAWTREHVGREMSPQEFLASPEAQDAVFKGQFGKYASAYGPEGAARAWFAGEGGMNDPARKDQLGTTVQSYGDQFTKNMGGPSAVAAAMSPSAALPPANAPAPPPTPSAPGALPTNQPTGIPPQQRQAIAALMMATPGSPAQQLGIQLAGQSLKPHDYTHQTLPDGTILRLDPTGKAPPQVVYQAQAKPQFVPNVGANPYGVPQPGFVDPLNKKAFDISGKPLSMAQGGNAPGASGDINLTGPSFLETLPKPQADQIKGIVEGRIAPPGAFALKTPYWQKMLTDVAQYEPGFDLTKWGARSATAKDFASGKSAQNITSFNTVLQHLDTLDKAADGLKNYSFTPANTVMNVIKSRTGEPAIKEFEVAKTAVADELTRAFRGTGGNVHDLVQWENAIDAASSPAQLKGAIKQAAELLRGRIGALGDTYNRGMNTQIEPVKLLSPKAQETLDRIGAPRRETKTAEPSAVQTATNPKTGERVQLNPKTGQWEPLK